MLMAFYGCHIMACIWLSLGQYNCKYHPELIDCDNGWIEVQGMSEAPDSTVYIFALYWIFEVITTVGYGDYSGSTTEELIFSMFLEFAGLTFFSLFMNQIGSVFNQSDNFQDLIDGKLDSLDMWIKKIEKSNKPYFIQPTLYKDIRRYVEEAFLFDFNLVVEEFDFYN
jgi:hypothetical protein